MRKIAILGFGGTISMVSDHGVLKPAMDVNEIIAMVPRLSAMADLTFESMAMLDSTNMTPNHWIQLAQKISCIQNQVEAIIVTHGTDTMAYTATAVSLSLGRGLKVPVVFTGSQLPLVDFGTDAQFNLENSLKVALSAIELQVAEVMIVFQDQAFRGNRTIKVSEARFPAFASPAFPPLAVIDAVGVHFAPTFLKALKKSELGSTLFPCNPPGFEDRVLTIDLVPGLRPDMLQRLIENGNCKGLLLRSLGAGNVPSEGLYSFLPLIKSAVKADIPVLVSTKFVGGTTQMEIYEPGKAALDLGAIPTGDMTDVTSQVKFMWALSWVGGGIRRMLNLSEVISESFAGEITDKN